MLVKLEKEIELEETLLLTEEPPPAVKTFSVCCQHGGLYQAGVSAPTPNTPYALQWENYSWGAARSQLSFIPAL